jgi:hypothetical protein
MQEELEKDVLTEEQAAKLVSVHARTLQRARLLGKPIFPVFMIGGRPRYSRAAILEKISIGSPIDDLLPKPAESNVDSQMRKPGRPRTKVSFVTNADPITPRF